MRVYNSCVEMLEETYRELWKRGQTIQDKTVQGRIVTDIGYEQKEIVFYNFRVDSFEDIEEMLLVGNKKFNKPHICMASAIEWFNDMINNKTLKENWWNLHPFTKEYFQKFCIDNKETGDAAYSYGERIIPQLESTIKRLKDNIYSRGALITMDLPTDADKIGHRRPCTNSYHFFARPTINGDQLNLVVNMRSADSINFLPLDFTKSYLFLKYMCEQVNCNIGFIIMSINSCHAYKKDIPGEYQW